MKLECGSLTSVSSEFKNQYTERTRGQGIVNVIGLQVFGTDRQRHKHYSTDSWNSTISTLRKLSKFIPTNPWEGNFRVDRKRRVMIHHNNNTLELESTTAKLNRWKNL